MLTMLLRGGGGANVIQPEQWGHLKNAIWSNKTSSHYFRHLTKFTPGERPPVHMILSAYRQEDGRGFIHGMRTRVLLFCRTHHYPASLTAGLHH